ncbi:MAG TPA: CapA family protein, partial [Pyrinomonadaceae bacterium]|nr:CapA family protein [Pyrinomonadaceae bacterium]
LLLCALPVASGSGPEVEIVAVGDILLDRGVARRIEREGTRAVFSRVRDTVSGADLSFGNLECPVTIRCERGSQRIAFRARPRYTEALIDAGFDILSLANNHSMDCGGAGLLETIRNLNASGLRSSGAGRTRKEAEAPVLLNVKGIRIASLSFTMIAPPTGRPPNDNEPSVAIASRSSVESAIVSARRDADVVIVSLHWGVEYSSRPSAEQVSLAHAAVEAGADVVLGHHTHTLAGLEVIRRRSGTGGTRYALVAYSLGNFVFDSPRWLGKRVTESAVLRFRLSRAGVVKAELLPVVLEDYLPRPANSTEARSILSRLATLSAELNTEMTNGQISLR